MLGVVEKHHNQPAQLFCFGFYVTFPPHQKKKVCRLKGLPGPQRERLVSESPCFRGSFSAWGAGGMPGM